MPLWESNIFSNTRHIFAGVSHCELFENEENIKSCVMAAFRNFNTLRPRQNGRHFPDDTFKCIFLNENVSISIKISPNCVPNGPINDNPALVQIILLSETMLVSLLKHICVTLPRWVNSLGSQNPPVPVNSPHKGQWRGALMISLICVWINGWVNDREAGDLRRYRGHYDVTVMPEMWAFALTH